MPGAGAEGWSARRRPRHEDHEAPPPPEWRSGYRAQVAAAVAAASAGVEFDDLASSVEGRCSSAWSLSEKAEAATVTRPLISAPNVEWATEDAAQSQVGPVAVFRGSAH